MGTIDAATKTADASFGLIRGKMRGDKPVSCLTSREVGMAGEDVACAYLERAGLEIVERNWKCHFGEADVICSLNDTTVVLVEVKTRSDLEGRGRDMPELAVGPAKRRRYTNIALCYINEHPRVASVRFDVVAVTITSQSSVHVHHIENAFSWDE